MGQLSATDIPYLPDYQGFTKERLDELGFKRLPEPWAEGDHWPDGLITLDGLKALNLAVYHNGHGVYLLGAADESLHPHERWLYHREAKNNTWRRIEHHANITVPAIALQEQLQKDLSELQTLQLKSVLARISDENAPYWSAANYWQSLAYPTSVRMSKADVRNALTEVILSSRITPADLHDLAYHYEAWAARNPEGSLLPKDLVWRMHGLQLAVECAAADRRAAPVLTFVHDGVFQP